MNVITYGSDPEQFGELRLPNGSNANPLVVLIHGGFWRDQYRLDLMYPLAEALADNGYATWNIEYRRVGPTGGGYPTTLEDVGAAIDRIAESEFDKLAVIGHSAGGHLALWNASRTDAVTKPDLTISLAGVADVIKANRRGTGVDATTNFFGGDYLDRVAAYTAGQPDPAAFAGRVVLIHGDADESVPLDQSTDLAPVVDRVEVLAGANHFDVIEPHGATWRTICDELQTLKQRP